MKKVIAILLSIMLVIVSVGCKDATVTASEVVKVGMVCIGDDNSAYDRNFYMAADNATQILKEKGIDIEWIYQYNKPDGDMAATANLELAEDGCKIIFNNSYGQEDSMLQVAKDYPNTHFVGLTNEGSTFDDLSNTHNAFTRVYEGRFLTGIAAGMKLNQLMAEGIITEPKLGYVGAYSFAEVISGFTAYYLGAKYVCPDVVMDVTFVGSWGDASLEASAAEALIGGGAIVVSQHSDNTTPATKAQQHEKFHTGYNISMSDVAPAASIISTRIDWTNYFVHAIECVVNGTELEQDYCQGLAEGEVVLTELNEAIAAPGTQEAIDEAIAKIKNGELKVFDTNTFTVNGEKVTQAFALDTDGDWIADSEEAIVNGEFLESYYKSAPYFALRIDGITWLNE